jgi:hypothetical protein
MLRFQCFEKWGFFFVGKKAVWISRGGPFGGEEQIEYCEAFLRAYFLLNAIKYGILEGVELNTTCILQTL